MISRARAALHDRCYGLNAIEATLEAAHKRARHGPEEDVCAKIGEAMRLIDKHRVELDQEFHALDQRELVSGLHPFDVEELAAAAPGRAELAHVARREGSRQ